MSSITRITTPYDLSPLSFDTPYEFPRHFLPTVMKGNTGLLCLTLDSSFFFCRR